MAHEITYTNKSFEIKLVVFTPKITTNHVITCTNFAQNIYIYDLL